MKKCFKILSLGLLCAFLLSGCAVHIGNMGSSTSLSSSNFKYVKKGVSASATATYIFGIGGLSKQALALEARQNLEKMLDLKENQALANVTVDFKRTMITVLYMTNECTIGADVVEFTK